VDKSL